MDVKDYSQKLDQAREKFRTLQDDLRTSYNKNLEDTKQTKDSKIEKLGKNYEAQKSKLEEQNLVNNQLYSDKSKAEVAENQARFRSEIKKNTEKFDIDRNFMKSDFNDKLANISDSYKKSTAENDRFHDQASRTMGERYNKANQSDKADFQQKIVKLDDKVREQFHTVKNDAKKERLHTDKEYQENLDNLRTSNQEDKFKEVSRLKNDNENLRINFAQERDIMSGQKDSRINDVLKLKSQENEDGQTNFSNLQKEIRKKSTSEEERVKTAHQADEKLLKKKFNEELSTMQKMTDQKIKGGNETSALINDNKQIINSYESRLASARADAQKEMINAHEKEIENDVQNTEKLKQLKSNNVDAMDKKESNLNAQFKQNSEETLDRTNTLIDRYKSEIGNGRVETEEKLSKADSKSKSRLKDQRVEFGKFINNVNDKNMEEMTSIKSEYTKDKTKFIEKSKRDYSEEKIMMKEGFNRQVLIKEDLYERKLADMEKQTNKIIENYENRIEQIARKAEKEVVSMKSMEDERILKESQLNRTTFDNMKREQQMELGNIREKYEGMIGKDRILSEQKTNRIIQRYEDQINRERIDHQKEISVKLGESQAQIERLFKASELEKETLRNQFEQRLENIKLTSMSEGNSKKS